MSDRLDAFHDDQEREEVLAILAALAPSHPAREAFKAGYGGGRIAELVGRADLQTRLHKAFLDGYARTLTRRVLG